jgi:hypothetical protein
VSSGMVVAPFFKISLDPICINLRRGDLHGRPQGVRAWPYSAM